MYSKIELNWIKLNKFWHQFLSFITTLCAGANSKFMKLMDLNISYGCTKDIKQGLNTGTVKIKLNHINFVILSNHVTVIYLRFIKNIYFYVIIFLSVTIKLRLSENLTFQNLLKKRKLLPAKKFRNILDLEKESKRKLLSHISRQFY